jgi:hypothetical protein
MATSIWTPENKREFLNRYDRGDSHSSIVRWATNTVGASIGVTSVPPYATQFRNDLSGNKVKALPVGYRPKLEGFSPEKLYDLLCAKGLTAASVSARIAQPVSWYLIGRAVPYTDGPAQRLAEHLGVSLGDLQGKKQQPQDDTSSLREALAKAQREATAAKEERDILFHKLESVRSVLA